MTNVMTKPLRILAAVVVVVLACCGCESVGRNGPGSRGCNDELVGRIDEALERASSYLVEAQSEDGAWRSETYGMFKNGEALTPYVMSSLFFMGQGGPEAREAWRKGCERLVGLIDEDGNISTGPEGLLFPVLTCASSSRMVVLETKDERHLRAQRGYLKHVMEYQLTEELGWSPEDPEYGGWGFSLKPPRKPGEGELRERFYESNMVATIFGIAAMRSARIPLTDPAWKKALIFAQRCQNFAEEPDRIEEQFDDGGFYFIPNDTLQNKAGIAGTDESGRVRYRSYGTMTADGLRVLLQCGLSREHPRVVAARKWLEEHFSVTDNPGDFAEDREVLRNATYYYWAWSVSHAFSRVGVREFTQNGRTVRWAEELAEELLKRQKPDGTWVNVYLDAQEDDPLVSTPWAAAALVVCREVMLAEPGEDINKCTKPEFPPGHPHGHPGKGE